MLWWAVAVGVYLSFVTLVWTQVVAGAIVGACVVGLSRTAARTAGLRLHVVVPRLWPPTEVVSIVASEVSAVAGALRGAIAHREPVVGRFVAFRAGERIDAGLDVALTLEVSVAPNTYLVAVVDLDEDAVVLAHQFAARPGVRRTFPRWRV